MDQVFEELKRSLDEGRPVVLATVAATRGSTLRRRTDVFVERITPSDVR